MNLRKKIETSLKITSQAGVSTEKFNEIESDIILAANAVTVVSLTLTEVATSMAMGHCADISEYFETFEKCKSMLETGTSYTGGKSHDYVAGDGHYDENPIQTQNRFAHNLVIILAMIETQLNRVIELQTNDAQEASDILFQVVSHCQGINEYFEDTGLRKTA